MVPILALWLPILAAAVIVFVASSLLHMVLPYHKGDYARLPERGRRDGGDAQGRRAAGRLHDAAPPGRWRRSRTRPSSRSTTKGPVGAMTIMPSGTPTMGRQLAQWFVYCVVVGIFAAYIAGRALQPGAHYLAVFRFAGATAFIGYSLALWQDSIWYKKKWSTTPRTRSTA